MAEPQSSAPSRARAGAPTSGVIHVRTRLTAEFTVIANALAQRPGSAVTVGVAAYILSLPDGAPVSIAALCAHFTEGEILISRALRELEEAGYLERRRERGPGGRIRTRTYFHDVPGRGGQVPAPPSRTEAAPAARPAPIPAAAPPPVPPPPLPGPSQEAPREPSQPPPSLADADPRAVAVLASLRTLDPRLILSGREAAQLAPDVARWLAAGVGPAQITRALTTGLPDRLLARPARLLAFRLSEPPLPAPVPSSTPPSPKPVVLPFQTCDGCERAFRAASPGRCRDCRTEAEPAAATAPGETLRVAC